MKQPAVKSSTFLIYRRDARTARWRLWCSDLDEAVMRTRFDYMFDVIQRAFRDKREYNAVRLMRGTEVLSEAELP